MIVFNECRIDSEGKHLIVEASVDNLDYFKNVFIESVVIDTQDTYSANGPSSNPIFSKVFDNTQPSADTDTVLCGCETTKLCCDNTGIIKSVRLIFNAKDLGVSLNDNIFFIYIGAGGTPSPACPCGMDNQYTMNIAVNLRPIYNMAMSYIRELESNCEVPKGFIDMILRLKAFKLSLKTGNYPVAFKWWDKLKSKAPTVPKKNCGCDGIY